MPLRQSVLAALLAISALAACQSDGGDEAALPPTPLQAAEEACVAAGGSFGRVPGAPEDAPEVRICYREPDDANTGCSAATDCEGACLARSRTCAPVIPLLGCHQVLSSSGVEVEQCID